MSSSQKAQTPGSLPSLLPREARRWPAPSKGRDFQLNTSRFGVAALNLLLCKALFSKGT